MKTILTLLLPAIALLTSCTSLDYYQLYEVKGDKNFKDENNLIYEDSKLKVTYKLWSEGGNLAIEIMNKTDNEMVIDLQKSFYILNNISSEYFENKAIRSTFSSSRTYTSSSYNPYSRYNWNSSTSSSVIKEEYSNEIKDKEKITIPDHSAIVLSNFNIVNERYIHCDLPKVPGTRNIKKILFIKDSSPINVRNIITLYSKNDTIKIDNSFHVSEISNYQSQSFEMTVDTSICGRKLEFGETRKIFKYQNQNAFFFKYNLKEPVVRLKSQSMFDLV